MDFKAKVEELRKKAPAPKYRASHGQWVQPAWLARALVEDGHSVVGAIRTVVSELRLEPADLAQRSIRQAYYEIRHREWPENMKPEGAKPPVPKPEPKIREVAIPLPIVEPKAREVAIPMPIIEPFPPAKGPVEVQTLPFTGPPPVQRNFAEDEEWGVVEIIGKPQAKRNTGYKVDPNFKL